MLISDLFTLFFLGLVSFVSNFISALAGGGAGLLQLPALLFFGLPFSKALATHKIASVALGLGASIPHSKSNNLQKKIIFLILISGVPGVIIGANVASLLPSTFSTILLGLLTLFLCVYSVSNKKLGNSNNVKKIGNLKICIGCLGLFIIGFLNGYLSSGTGLFVTLWLITIFNLSFSAAIAHTLILVGIVWNGIGAISLGLSGNIVWNYIPILILASLLGGYFGAYFSIIKGSKFIKLVFEIVSLSVGISLLIKAFFDL